ncbi:hypothetical protein BCV69DRAFT_280810 [Microstroma glucosiphilum]|uniref:RRM domain-containing protein n=1 Tax=Pseudomicrostroma glucosiphilum TaxID=1684307 RepID=A0A316UDC2_9BASI|nr:hypothetical protein BCV69DRAFT_280810 [Pseudomicrostroma glucosiphilum]PWN23199.1 hypothetical protein BCV69DRAFT_280810 [Pseudomicrostroma glucosiphilum]
MPDSIWAPRSAARAQPGHFIPDTSCHPHLLSPRLHLSDHPPEIPDSALANGPLKPFRPIKICIQRDSTDALDGGGTSGTIEFQNFHSAEKALATISTISLSINPPGAYQVPSSATPVWVRNLPIDVDEGYLFDLFRPFGPLQSVRCIKLGPRDDVLGTAKLYYFREESARLAKSIMDGTEVEGQTISVTAGPTAPATQQETTRTAPRSSPMSAAAAPFVPRNSLHMSPRAPHLPPSLPATPPPRVQQEGFQALLASPNYMPAIPLPAQLHPINGPILPVPGTNLKYSPRQSTYIDPRNLYCKNLDHSIDDDALTTIFQEFGQIVSARVITDDNSNSRGHGFVSFHYAEEAAHALAALNGALIRGRPMYVRLHEPKEPRKNKLARQFGVGGSSGSPSDRAGTSNPSQPNTPRRGPANELAAAASAQGDRVQPPGADLSMDKPEGVAPIAREERENPNWPGRQPYLRNTLLGQISVAPAALNGTASVRDIVDALATLQIDDQLRAMMNPSVLEERIIDVHEGRLAPPTLSSRAETALGLTGVPSPHAEENPTADNGLTTEAMPLPAGAGNAEPAGGLESQSNALSDEERKQLLSAVTGALPEGSPVDAVTDRLASLDWRDRALCLHNDEYLVLKIREAESARSIVAGPETSTGQVGAVEAKGTALGISQPPTETSVNHLQYRSKASQTEESSFVIPLETLAERNCREIIALVEAAAVNETIGMGGIHPSELPLGPVTNDQRRDAALRLQGILKERRHVDQKQRLGDILYHEIKAALKKSKYPCHRGYPAKITIALLEEGIPAAFGDDHDIDEKQEEQPDAESTEKEDKGKGKAKEDTSAVVVESAPVEPTGSTSVKDEKTSIKTTEETPAGLGTSGSTNPTPTGENADDASEDRPPIFHIPATQQVRRHLDAQQHVLEQAEHSEHFRSIVQVIVFYPDLFRVKVLREARKLGAKPVGEE